jgi:hypothetical protein
LDSSTAIGELSVAGQVVDATPTMWAAESDIARRQLTQIIDDRRATDTAEHLARAVMARIAPHLQRRHSHPL